MLSHRLLLGPVLIAALVGLFGLDMWLEGTPTPEALRSLGITDPMPPGAIVAMVVALVGIAVGIELAGLHPSPTRFMSLCIPAAAVAGLCGGLSGSQPGGLVLGAVVAIVLAIAPHWASRRTEGALETIGLTLFSFAFLGVLPCSLVFMRGEFGAWVVLSVLLTVKSSDIGAYFTGTAIGRHKLIPWLSPGKTWEGLAGGVVTSAVVGGVLFWQLGSEDGLSMADGFWIGAILALAGQFGDLSGSLLKRSSGVKNSGRVPGFGGVLDLADSAFFAAPVALWLMRYAANALVG